MSSKVPKFKSFKERIDFYFEDVDTLPGKLTDITVILLVIISSAIFVIQTYDIPDSLKTILTFVDFVIIFLFTIEYLLRLWVAKHKIKHIFNIYSIFDLAVLAPFYLGISGSGFVRVFRVLRILRLSRFIKSQFLFGHTNSDFYIIIRLGYTLLAILFVFSGLIYSIEHVHNPDRFGTFFDAIYYSVVTVTTVGFGDITPISTLGKIVTIVMILVGIVLIPANLGLFLRKMTITAGKIKAKCKKCGELYHDPDAIHCKKCGAIIKVPTKERYT